MLVRFSAPVALALVSLSAACGGSVVFEEDGGAGLSGQGGGEGGSRSTSSADGGSSSTSTNVTTNVSSGPQSGPTSTGQVGPTVTVGPGPGPSVTTGGPGCGTLIDDLGGLGAGAACDSCAEASCCGQLLSCSQGTACWDCIFGGSCSGQGQNDIQSLVDCINGPSCQDACNGGNQCNKEEFTCFSGEQCVPFNFVCDGRFDCGDGSDESPQVCGGCTPGDFVCNDGSCIPGDFECDGIVDCQGGEDEACMNNGICDSGIDTGDPQANECLGDQCCFQFEQCSQLGQDVEACFECFNQGGGPLCDDAISCAQNSGCFGGGQTDICGTGFSTGDPGTDECLSDSCCGGFFTCLDAGQDACLECLNDPAHGSVCNEFSDCSCSACGFCF